MYSTQCTVVMHVTKRASNFAFAFIVAAVVAEKSLRIKLYYHVSIFDNIFGLSEDNAASGYKI